jgi:hypothetical protein
MLGKRVFTIFCLGLMVFSLMDCYYSPIFNRDIKKPTNSEDNDSLLNIDTNSEDFHQTSPNSAAYYRGLDFGLLSTFEASISSQFNNEVRLTDVARNATHYFFTGHTIGTDGNRSLIVIIALQSNLQVVYATTWRADTSVHPQMVANYPTGGLAIEVDVSRNLLYVGGYYDFNETISPQYETYGSGVLIAFNLVPFTVAWQTNISRNVFFDNGDSFLGDPYYRPWNYGGERVEDILLLDDGSIVVTGAFSFWVGTFEPYDIAVNVFWAKYNATGDLQWFQLDKNLGSFDGSTRTYIASVGRNLIYNPVSDTLFLHLDRKTYYLGVTHNNEGMYESILYLINTNDGTRKTLIDRYIQTNSFSLFITAYNITNSIVVDSKGTMWAYGTNVSTPMYSSTLWKINSAGVVESKWSISSLNTTGEMIVIDQNDTLYLLGELIDNNWKHGLRYTVIDPYRSGTDLFIINSGELYETDSTKIMAAVFDQNTLVVNLIGYLNKTGFDSGFVKRIGSAISLPNSILSPLPTETKSQTVALSWNTNNSLWRYWYLFRSTEPIVNLNGLLPIAKVEFAGSYNDVLPTTYDGVLVYYALLTGNDNINSSTFSTQSTTIYLPPLTPLLSLNPSSKILLGQNVTLIWNIVKNASMFVYARPGNLLVSQLNSLTPVAIFEDNASINSMSFQPTQVGLWSFALRAVNDTRLNSTSTIKTLSVESIAISPTTVNILDGGTNLNEGIVMLDWPDVSGCQYNVYGRKGATINNWSETLTMIPLNPTPLSESQYRVTGLSSGQWYFVVHSLNSSGNATGISNAVSAIIQFIPLQPQVYLEKTFTEDGVFVITWDVSSEALNYTLYRAYDNQGAGLCETNISRMTRLYSGSGLTYTDLVSEDGFYFYVVVAANQYGSRVINCELGVIGRKATPSAPNNSLYTGLIIGGSIFGAAMVVWIIYKKRNPY